MHLQSLCVATRLFKNERECLFPVVTITKMGLNFRHVHVSVVYKWKITQRFWCIWAAANRKLYIHSTAQVQQLPCNDCLCLSVCVFMAHWQDSGRESSTKHWKCSNCALHPDFTGHYHFATDANGWAEPYQSLVGELTEGLTVQLVLSVSRCYWEECHLHVRKQKQK